MNAPSLTFASGTHWVMLLMPGISTTLVVLKLMFRYRLSVSYVVVV